MTGLVASEIFDTGVLQKLEFFGTIAKYTQKLKLKEDPRTGGSVADPTTDSHQ